MGIFIHFTKLRDLESEYDKDTVITSVKEKILLRKNAANLASMLYKHLNSKHIEIPKQLHKWKEICANPDEFAEVRNQWRVY